MDHLAKKQNDDFTIHLLKALPLLHFLRGICNPEQQSVPHHPVEVIWGDPVLMLRPAKKGSASMLYIVCMLVSCGVSPCRFMKMYYREFKSLFPLDPLLFFSVAYVCPLCEITYLLEDMHLPFAMSLVAKRFDGIQSKEVRHTDLSAPIRDKYTCSIV